MNELAGFLLLTVGLSALGATGALAACCLRLRSMVAFLLAAYLVAWMWVVTLTLALSPVRWVTRGSLVAGLLLGLMLALAAWIVAGRPPPPGVRRALWSVRDALRDPAVLVLAVAVALGTTYIVALAFFTPSNDMDALEYHLARAALWRQNHGLGHIDQVDDARVNLFPPNAEIGELATMLLASNDRYAALPQLLAYAALVLCVAGLARRVGFGNREAVFAALAFATLPVVAVQAPSAMNDLVVASFLAAAAYFGVGRGRATLLLFALAVALAVGTKYTTIMALPTLALVAAIALPPRRLLLALGAGVAGCIAGSAWYMVNVVETGDPGAEVPNQPNQRADLSPVPVTVMVLRLAISFVDMSGAPWPYSLAFLVSACVLVLAGLIRIRRSRRDGVSLLVAAGLSATVVATPLIWELVVRAPFKLALVLGRRDVVERFGWVFNTKAEPLVAGYGPLGLYLILVGSGAVIVAWRRRQLPAIAVAFAAAPLVVIATLSLMLSYDVTRVRFLLFGVALAAATWGVTLRFRGVTLAAAAIGATTLFLALGNYHGKPSGLFSESSIWDMPRWQAQTTRNGLNSDVLAYVEESVPMDARVGLSLVGDDWIHPFFGPNLSRHVTIVSSDGGTPPDDAEWLVLAPETKVTRCPGSWRPAYVNGYGWRVERRLAPDDCLDASP